jgi:DNA protecting protein DprA
MVSTAMLRLALLGLNPERASRLLAEGAGPTGALRLVADLEGPELRLPDGISFVARGAEGFPERLAETLDSPHWLFVRGSIPTTPMVAIVGSRNTTAYGSGIAERLGSIIGAAGWPVVSGLARGVDAAAHRGCVSGGGRAVAVLGSGIDVWYPTSNRSLGERVLESGGAVISEAGPGVTPEPWRFPFRNRIISGLSEVVIVVEAAERSGALITASTAVAQGREVMVVPGDLTRPTSAGCNALIRDGAHPIVDLESLVDELELLIGPAPRRSKFPEVAGLEGMKLPATVDDIVKWRGGDRTATLTLLFRMEAARAVTVSDGVVYPA